MKYIIIAAIAVITIGVSVTTTVVVMSSNTEAEQPKTWYELSDDERRKICDEYRDIRIEKYGVQRMVFSELDVRYYYAENYGTEAELREVSSIMHQRRMDKWHRDNGFEY